MTVAGRQRLEGGTEGGNIVSVAVVASTIGYKCYDGPHIRLVEGLGLQMDIWRKKTEVRLEYGLLVIVPSLDLINPVPFLEKKGSTKNEQECKSYSIQLTAHDYLPDYIHS
ncbi:hypothetical protein RDABS01_018738 [Bienertia sinuspersici]